MEKSGVETISYGNQCVRLKKRREKKMKLKKFMMLQLFAEGSEGSDGDSGNEGTDGKDPETKEQEDDEEDDPEEEKKYSDKDVNKIIDRKFAEWTKKKQKEEDEAKKLSKMNAQEKADYKQKQLEEEIEQLKNEKALSNMRDEARKMLSEKNINITDELLAFMVSTDAGETKKAVDSFADLFNAAVNEAVKGKARQTTPKESGAFSGGTRNLGIGDMAREARIIK